MPATSVPRLRVAADRAAAVEDLAASRAAGSGPITVIRRTPRLPMRGAGRPDHRLSPRRADGARR